MWDWIVPALAESSRVINIDCRGHRYSTTPGPFTFDDLVADWLAIMDTENIERATLIGLSMGAMTAMRFALSYPSRVTGLALLNTSADREPPLVRLKYAALATLYKQFGLINLIKAPVIKLMFGKTTLEQRKNLIEQLISQVDEHQRTQLVHAIRCVTDRPSILSQLNQIHAPTLLLVGEEDVATPLFRSERIQKHLSQAALIKLPNAGHLSAVETPKTVIKSLITFINQCNN
jgi:pimeloyl-ACP methyl ester carboxylesterase